MRKSTADYTEEDFDTVMNLNLKARVSLMRCSSGRSVADTVSLQAMYRLSQASLCGSAHAVHRSPAHFSLLCSSHSPCWQQHRAPPSS